MGCAGGERSCEGSGTLRGLTSLVRVFHAINNDLSKMGTEVPVLSSYGAHCAGTAIHAIPPSPSSLPHTTNGVFVVSAPSPRNQYCASSSVHASLGTSSAVSGSPDCKNEKRASLGGSVFRTRRKSILGFFREFVETQCPKKRFGVSVLVVAMPPRASAFLTSCCLCDSC